VPHVRMLFTRMDRATDYILQRKRKRRQEMDLAGRRRGGWLERARSCRQDTVVNNFN
jgi:hypothetical protein